ncbi:miniconductance mechanosensitive channel YbdG [bacterium BMS3Abin02]|nr:miniconductance mechanosensitive channel YbdG [bacterium BMS3Abin02]
METAITNLFERWLGAGIVATLVAIAAVVVVAVLSYFAVRVLALPVIRRTAKRTTFRWDDVFADRTLQHRISLLIPALILYAGVSAVPGLGDFWTEVWRSVAGAGVVLISAMALGSLLAAINTIYETFPISKDRPIKGYLQVVQMFIYLFAAVLIVAVFTNQSPWFFISGIGAATAVLLLVFKDTILSFIASIQLASNDMLRVGDWIEMPDFNADGDVIDIALHTVKVQNWDKTITTIPTYKLISESFKNWRGMAESGGRRIKRAVNIDMSSVRFLTDDEVERFTRFVPLADYMAAKRREIEEYNAANEPPEGMTGDPRRLTNIGTLRAYMVSYLKGLPDIAKDMTFIIRQLEPGPKGLPLEIYVFSSDTRWPQYEALQADIFDHLLAMLPEFGLRPFQEPTGADFRSL